MGVLRTSVSKLFSYGSMTRSPLVSIPKVPCSKSQRHKCLYKPQAFKRSCLPPLRPNIHERQGHSTPLDAVFWGAGAQFHFALDRGQILTYGVTLAGTSTICMETIVSEKGIRFDSLCREYFFLPNENAGSLIHCLLLQWVCNNMLHFWKLGVPTDKWFQHCTIIAKEFLRIL